MESQQLRGIYLHGYQGFVTDEKKEFLEEFGNVYAPFTDYETQTDIIFKLYEQFKNETIDFVSGTSLGAILGFHLAKLLNVPCLLFNPAVIAMDQIKGFIPTEAFEVDYHQNSLLIVGLKDEIIDPLKQLDFFKEFDFFTIIKEDELEHSIPLDIFVKSFNEFKNIL
jgi:uncharacterized protein